MTVLSVEDWAELPRWLIAALSHAGVTAALLEWRDTVHSADPAGAIVVEFAPEFVAARRRGRFTS
jgi:hypothetical protein